MSTAGPPSTALIESMCPGVPYPGAGLSFRCPFPISARGSGGLRDTGEGSQFGGQQRCRILSVKAVTAIFDSFFIVFHRRILVSFRNRWIYTTSLSDSGSVQRRGKKG